MDSSMPPTVSASAPCAAPRDGVVRPIRPRASSGGRRIDDPPLPELPELGHAADMIRATPESDEARSDSLDADEPSAASRADSEHGDDERRDVAETRATGEPDVTRKDADANTIDRTGDLDTPAARDSVDTSWRAPAAA